MVVSEQKIETAQDAGCDADHCNQERNSGHGLSFGEGAGEFLGPSIGEGNDEEWRAPAQGWAM
jgi:hypothetical protein